MFGGGGVKPAEARGWYHTSERWKSWEQSSGHLEEQQSLLSAETSLAPQTDNFKLT